MATLWQQAVAQDARYNAYRTPDNPQYSKLASYFADYCMNRCLHNPSLYITELIQ